MTGRIGGVVTLGLLAAGSLTARAAHAQTDPDRWLRSLASASNDELAGLAAGVPLVKTVDTGDAREMTQVYVVRVAAPVSFVLDQIRRTHLLLDEADDGRSRGRFGDPPEAGDLSELSLTRGQVRDLERCRPRSCELKLPEGTIERMHRSIDWASETAQEDATRFFREMLVETLTAYAAAGDRPGFAYEDKEERLEVGAGFAALFEGARYLDEFDEPLRRYLEGYPAGRSPDVEDLFSWTVERLGTKSLVSLNHIAFKAQSATTGAAIIGVKRIYASHYFHAGLRFVAITPASGPGGADSYITVVVRLRFDGELGGIRRVAIERRLERNAEAVLRGTKQQFEAGWLQLAANGAPR